jgi:hypothetical protein
MSSLRALVPSFAAVLLVSSIVYAVGQGVAQRAEGDPRLQAIISSGGAIVRGVGVAKVTHEAAGRYCIKPKGNLDLDLENIFPLLTIVDADSANHGIAAYDPTPDGCPSNTIEVRTSLLLSPGSNEPAFFPVDRSFVIVVH